MKISKAPLNINQDLKKFLIEHYRPNQDKTHSSSIEKIARRAIRLKKDIETGKITDFKEIFQYLPIRLVCRLLNFKSESLFSKKINTPDLFKIHHIELLAKYLNVDVNLMTKLFIRNNNQEI